MFLITVWVKVVDVIRFQISYRCRILTRGSYHYHYTNALPMHFKKVQFLFHSPPQQLDHLRQWQHKILAINRHIKLATLAARLSSIASHDVCFKDQLRCKDLDALIFVTNNKGLNHMTVEFNRMCRNSHTSARLRLILFPLPDATITTNNNSNINALSPPHPSSAVTKLKHQFVNALNGRRDHVLVTQVE